MSTRGLPKMFSLVCPHSEKISLTETSEAKMFNRKM